MPRYSFTFVDTSDIEVIAPSYMGALHVAADMRDGPPLYVTEHLWDGDEVEDLTGYESLRQYIGTLGAV